MNRERVTLHLAESSEIQEDFATENYGYDSPFSYKSMFRCVATNYDW